VVIDAQLRVVHVEPGGGADQVGLRVGDRLQAIAGVALVSGDRVTLQQAREAAGAAQPPPPTASAPVLFVVEREGATLTLSIAPALKAPRETPGEPVPTVTPVLPPFDYF
jgi:C-terminal processing protease CtpA/Prc